MVSILNAAGTEVVHYTYDAWGAPLSTTGTMASSIGWFNPLRYRGYVYDRETDLYYLQSRYYDPQLGRFISADDPAFLGTGNLTSFNLFAYCNNNPCNKADSNGQCSYFFSFKLDCFMATCPTSQYYNPEAPNIAVIYDGRESGEPWPSSNDGDGGFQHQGQELVKRLSFSGYVTGYSYETMDEFVEVWNSLGGSYDAIYILGHGQPGKFNARGGTLQDSGTQYSYSCLNKVDVAEMHLYICNGDTWPQGHASTVYNFAKLTGAKVHAVKNGKLNFTWYRCFPWRSPWCFGEWTTTYLG